MPEQASEPTTLTVNQVVAYNLRRARLEREWTQDQAATALSLHLGVRWSKATYSAAERSAEKTSRIRGFTADDIGAFAATFEQPIAYFFIPPLEVDLVRHLIRCSTYEDANRLTDGEFLRVIFGPEEAAQAVINRVAGIMELLPEVGNRVAAGSRYSLWLMSQGIAYARREQAANDVESALDSIDMAKEILTEVRDALNGPIAPGEIDPGSL